MNVTMSSDPSFDPEFFQKLLESAFAVQESGMNARPLARIVEIQRAIRAGHLDVDGTMQLVVECARQVADASGVAVGRVTGDQLVYRAGSGSAASSVGRCVMATFIASAPKRTRAEILRVENATTDGRIEAAICRQFEANSLIILPIYHVAAVAGVMQVLFNEAHSFLEQEVRIYRLLAGLVGEAISQTALLEKQTAAPRDEPEAEPDVDLMPAPTRDPLDRPQPAPAAAGPAVVTPPVEVTRVPALAQSRKLASRWRSRPAPPWHYGGALRSSLVVAGVLMFGSWILYRDRPSGMFSKPPSEIRKPLETAPPYAPAQQVSPGNSPNSDAAGYAASRSSGYAASSSTVRYLPPRAPKGKSDLGNRVRYFGDDVTVRYFDPKSAPVKAALREGDLHQGDVRRISDDVTVRYFSPRNAERGRTETSADKPVTR
jgi:hypothetical protein